MKGDRDVREEGDEIVGVIEGYMDEVRVKKSVVEKAAIKRGHGGWVKIAVPNEEVVGRVTGHAVEEEQDQKALEIASTVDFADTLCMVRNHPSFNSMQVGLRSSTYSACGSFDLNTVTRRTSCSEELSCDGSKKSVQSPHVESHHMRLGLPRRSMA